jgi:hypothetical protein
MTFDSLQHVTEPAEYVGRIASRSNAPAAIRTKPPFIAATQKWLVQN